MRRIPWLVVFALSFSVLCLASAWAQDPPSGGSTLPALDASSPPSAPTSPPLSDLAARLLALSTELSSEASEQSIELTESRSLLAESRTALVSLQSSLDQAAADLRRQALALDLWRSGALVASGAALGALAGQGRGALIGAGSGAVAAGLWALWPILSHPLRLPDPAAKPP